MERPVQILSLDGESLVVIAIRRCFRYVFRAEFSIFFGQNNVRKGVSADLLLYSANDCTEFKQIICLIEERKAEESFEDFKMSGIHILSAWFVEQQAGQFFIS